MISHVEDLGAGERHFLGVQLLDKRGGVGEEGNTNIAFKALDLNVCLDFTARPATCLYQLPGAFEPFMHNCRQGSWLMGQSLLYCFCNLRFWRNPATIVPGALV